MYVWHYIVVITLGGFAVFGKYLKSGALACIWENPLLVGSAANSLIINIALGETVIEFSAIVWYWGKECTWIMCKRLDDNSQQVDSGMAGEKIYL